VLISSANQLAREGLAGYVKTLLDASNLLRTKVPGCIVLPAPFVLLGGTMDPHLIRAIFELHAWVRISGVDPDGVLNDSFAVIEHNIRANQGDRIQPIRMVYKLPMVGTGVKETCVVSDGPTNLPVGVGAVTEATEKLIVTSLLARIRETFAINIDTDPWTSRLAANSKKTECCSYVVIGGGHAEKLADTYRREGASCKYISMPGYRASNIHAGKLKEQLDAVDYGPSTTFILQMFDDSFYMSATEEGGLIPLSKDLDGNLHCFGELVVAPKELQHKVFKQVAEEISKIKNNPIIILAPLPRYREQPCCNNPGHMANRGQAEFRKILDESVYQSRVNFKDFAFRYGLRNVRTVGTWSSVKRMVQPWADQIHLTGEGYSLIARAVVEAIEELKKKRSGGEAVEAPKAKRP
jgi:hypothetical protein